MKFKIYLSFSLLPLLLLACTPDASSPKEEPLIPIVEKTVKVKPRKIISTDSLYQLLVYETITKLPRGYEHLSKDTLQFGCLEISKIDTTSIILLADYITVSPSAPEYYLTAFIQNGAYASKSSNGLTVKKHQSYKFLFSSDVFNPFNDSTKVIIDYDSPFRSISGSGSLDAFNARRIEFKLGNLLKEVKKINGPNKEAYPLADKKWFQAKGIQRGIAYKAPLK